MIYIKIVCRELGVTQAEVVRRTGIHSSTINNIFNERAKPWPKQGERIFLALKELGYKGTMDELFKETDE